MDIVFHGWIDEKGNHQVTVREENETLEANLPLYQNEYFGVKQFNWGATGMGQNQLAYSVLRFFIEHGWEYTSDFAKREAVKMYERFAKYMFYIPFDVREWEMTGEDVRRWLKEHRGRNTL